MARQHSPLPQAELADRVRFLEADLTKQDEKIAMLEKRLDLMQSWRHDLDMLTEEVEEIKK